MHHLIRPVPQAAGGRAQGSRVHRRRYAVLAALTSLLAGFGGTKVDVHGLFQIASLPSVGVEVSDAKVELTIAARGGPRVDEGDAERQRSGQRAPPEVSGKRSASGSMFEIPSEWGIPSDSPGS